MIVVIPAAGASERFGLAGYPMPKPCLPLPGDGTLIERVIVSIPPSKGDRLYVVVQAKFAHALSAPLLTAKLGRPHLDMVLTDRLTDGPLASVLAATRHLRGRDELLVHYCDCFLEGGELAEFVADMRRGNWEAGAVAFASADERFGRTPYGRWAVGGVFWFREAHQFLKHAKRVAHAGAGVPDVVWSYMQYDVKRYAPYVASHYVDLGVPKDYESYVVSAPLPSAFREVAR